jgi:alpha-glucosidase
VPVHGDRDYDWFQCGTSECHDDVCYKPPRCPPPDKNGNDFGYNPEIFSDPAAQLEEIRTKYHFAFGGIRKPRCFSKQNCAFLNESGWLLREETAGPNPFGPRNINFTSAEAQLWWAANSSHFLTEGVSYWWNDEGETQFFNYHYWNMAQESAQRMALPGTRHFTINRAFTPGLQRFPAVTWSGDGSDCSHAMALRFVRGGASLITCDMRSDGSGKDPLPLLRQYQNAVFLPVMRVHELHGDRSRFPFAWVADDSALGAAFRSALQLRYALIPQIYSWLHHAEAKLSSIVAPAIDLFPAAGGASSGSSAAPPWAWQYVLGEVLLPASHDGIEGSGAAGRSNVTGRLPPGAWLRLNTSSVTNGPAVLHVTPAVDEIVAFVRDGTILALDGNHDVQYSSQQGGVLEVQVYMASPSSAVAGNEFVEDDGVTIASGTRTTSFAFDAESKALEWAMQETGGGIKGVGTAYTHVRGVLFVGGVGGGGPGVTLRAASVPLSRGRLVFTPPLEPLVAVTVPPPSSVRFTWATVQPFFHADNVVRQRFFISTVFPCDSTVFSAVSHA